MITLSRDMKSRLATLGRLWAYVGLGAAIGAAQCDHQMAIIGALASLAGNMMVSFFTAPFNNRG